MHSLIAPTLNLLVLIGILVYFLRKPLREFVNNRHTSLRNELQRVAEQLKAAQAQYDEFSAKLKSMEVEVSALRDQARQDGEGLKVRIVNQANRVADAIVSDAQSSANTLIEDLQNQMRRELSVNVLKRAELLTQQGLNDQARAMIRKDFSRQLELSK